VFYGLPWLQWGERQAVLFDLAARRFYIFGFVLYPQDFIYLTGLLVLSALSLFLFTAVAGGCGAASPARRPSTPRCSCGSSARWKATAGPHAAGRAGFSLEKLVKKWFKHLLWPAWLVDGFHLRGLILADPRARAWNFCRPA
jgi:hypothetical protein